LLQAAVQGEYCGLEERSGSTCQDCLLAAGQFEAASAKQRCEAERFRDPRHQVAGPKRME
jgi:hypothetical protein